MKNLLMALAVSMIMWSGLIHAGRWVIGQGGSAVDSQVTASTH
ncbi:hypothetical protein [Oryzifoliimicrobium ureilyticus]